jgi:transcriptional regulator NrdR family protein
LVKVKKRSEDFNKAKLKASIKKAGAKDAHATKVADKIASKVKAGTTTVLIRRWVITELRPLDPKAAEAYMKYKKPASLEEAYMKY